MKATANVYSSAKVIELLNQTEEGIGCFATVQNPLQESNYAALLSVERDLTDGRYVVMEDIIKILMKTCF